MLTEEGLVEKPAVETAQRMGWEYIPAERLERPINEPLLEDVLRKAISRLNLGITQTDVERAVARLKSEPMTPVGGENVLHLLKVGANLKTESGDTRTIRYIDFADERNNSYIVSRQVELRGAAKGSHIIPDVLFFVNGIPLVILEAKNPADPKVSWETGYGQIISYQNLYPELFKYVQFGIATEIKARYFPAGIENHDAQTSIWKGAGTIESEQVMGMLDKQTLLDLVANFIFYRDVRGKMTKVMARYIQYEATGKIIQRIRDYQAGKDNKRSGLIWHWQGSGKTLTIIFSAWKAYAERLAPTVFIVLDRQELEGQLSDEMKAIRLPYGQLEEIDSAKKLKRILGHGEGMGKHGIFVVLVHKFRESIDEPGYRDRKDVLLLIDEAHRTQYGQMASNMQMVFQSAPFFGFTGTPISMKERDTFVKFGYPAEKEAYMHRYFIKESIDDGFTVPIVVQTKLLAKAKFNSEIKKLLKEFVESELEEIPEEYKERAKSRIAQHLNRKNLILEREEFIKILARDIAAHFKTNLEKSDFKAMVVAPSRKACVLIKKELDAFFPKEYSRAVITYSRHTDGPEITAYRKALEEEYRLDISDINKRIYKEDFKKKEYPKILIVTDMLLAGFDAPQVQTMYLFKPIKDHRLLQALARTNRPYRVRIGDKVENIKPVGLVIDYIGIVREFRDAVKKYHEFEDISFDEFGQDVETIVAETIKQIDGRIAEFGGIRKDSAHVMALIKRINENKEQKRAFISEMPLLMYRLDALRSYFPKEFMPGYFWLCDIYFLLLRFGGKSEEEAENYYRAHYERVMGLVKSTVPLQEKQKTFAPIKLYDPAILANLGRDEREFLDLSFAMAKAKMRYEDNPAFVDILDRVESIVRDWEEGKKELAQSLAEMKSAEKELNGRQDEMRTLGMDMAAYTLMLVLKRRNFSKPQETAIGILEKLREKNLIFPGWHLKMSVRNEVARILRMDFLLGGMDLAKVTPEEVDSVCEELLNALRSA